MVLTFGQVAKICDKMDQSHRTRKFFVMLLD